MEKINLVEILKDCPKGMELDCTMYEDVALIHILEGNAYPIKIETPEGQISLNKYGQYSNNKLAKCIIFPKGKTTWEGFQKPFKDGDILINGLEDGEYNPFIFKQTNGLGNAQCYCAINCFKELILNSDNWTPIKGCRLATEEEKEKLFQAIKDNGYKWNAETKSLEKLVQPKFKVGDMIVKKDNPTECWYVQGVNTNCNLDYFYYIVAKGKIANLHFKEQDDYELIPNKFDITTLKPFQKVLVRDSDKKYWSINLFGFYNEITKQFHCMGNSNIGWNECIPYEGNEHLLGTTDNCNEFYKNW